MTGLSALALTLALLGGHNGHRIIHQLDRPEVRELLPIEFALDVAPRIRIGFHHQSELPRAFFSPDTLWRSDPGGPLTALHLGPVINLQSSTYRDQNGLKSPLDLRIDENQPYFEALIEAYLELRVLPASKGYLAVMKQRAIEVFTEVPAPQQLGAYFDALAAFGSDILTVAIQVERSTQKHRARGSDLCRFANNPRPTLYTLWRRNFAETQYQGMYRDERGAWRQTSSAIKPEDKALFVDQVFEGRWTGDPVLDFCSTPASTR